MNCIFDQVLCTEDGKEKDLPDSAGYPFFATMTAYGIALTHCPHFRRPDRRQ